MLQRVIQHLLPPGQPVGYKPRRLLITSTAVEEMVRETLGHPTIETAWGLAGFLTDGHEVIVTNVLKPARANVSRGYATVTLGGDHLANAVTWLAANYQYANKNRTNPSSWKYCFLYKGHSHHTLGLEAYSSTDNDSILDAVKSGLQVAIGPLANIKRNDGFQVGPYLRARSHALSVSWFSKVYLRFYYLDAEMVQAGIQRPVLVEPVVISAKNVPLVPPQSWQFAHEDDFMEQLRHLNAYGCEVTVLHRDTNGKPPYEVQFLINRPTWNKSVSIVTSFDHPRTLPKIDVLPKRDGPSMNQHLYAHASHLRQGELYVGGEDFIETVFRLEARGLV